MTVMGPVGVMISFAGNCSFWGAVDGGIVDDLDQELRQCSYCHIIYIIRVRPRDIKTEL